MKRLAITLDDIAARENLLLAVDKAARGKRRRPDVRRWIEALETNLGALASGILGGDLPLPGPRLFTIHDPKTRTIGVAPFQQRVLHHALLNRAEPRFEQMLVPSSFGCRPGRGVHAAVRHAQLQLRRRDWWLQMDVAGYFGSVDHGSLRNLLERRFKGQGVLDLMNRIIASAVEPGSTHGLPIGFLTSQHFANAYLDAADRWLLARPDVGGHVRYMDDIVVWCGSRNEARAVYREFASWLEQAWHLRLKPARIGRSASGLVFCGFRVRRGQVLPGRRKLERFRRGAKAWVRALRQGAEAADLQRAHDGLRATLAHTESLGFRRRVWGAAAQDDGGSGYSGPA